MVYETKTFILCHELSDHGKQVYDNMIDFEADKIIWKHNHPIKYFLTSLYNLLIGNYDD